MKHAARLLLLAILCPAVGCHHAGTTPAGWYGQTITAPDTNNPASHTQGNGIRATGTLQVIICYGKVLSNHTALRLTAPDQNPLLWDPGGTYRQDDPAYARRHDVLTNNAPSIDEWWRYRRDGCREPVMEVYQWSIDAEQARRLHAVLLNRADPADPSQTFEPDAGGLQCSTRVSEFLMRFADGRPGVTKKFFWPHKLGEHLWGQNPDSVTVYRADAPPPLTATAAPQPSSGSGMAPDPAAAERSPCKVFIELKTTDQSGLTRVPNVWRDWQSH